MNCDAADAAAAADDDDAGECWVMTVRGVGSSN